MFFNYRSYRLSRAVGMAIIVVPMLLWLTWQKPRAQDAQVVQVPVGAVEVIEHEGQKHYHAYLSLKALPELKQDRPLEVMIRPPHQVKVGDLVPVLCETFEAGKQRCKFVKEVFDEHFNPS